MGWLSSLFSMDTSQRSRKGQVFSSTHEAFSLPTSSPIFPTHPDAFNPDALNTPDPESARSPSSYTYPPQGPSAYGYVPSSAGFNSRLPSASLLPTHMDPLHTPFSVNSSYPPLSKTWVRIRSWLSREYPELGDTLNYGILPQDLAQIEMQFGFSLPAVVRESYLCVDGQEAESSAGCSEGLFFGLTLLPLESVLEEWRFWREVDNDPSTGANESLRQSMQSIPTGWVRKEYSQRGWIPLVADKAGNYLGIDLNPAESGSVGQVIVFGRDFDTKVVLWNGDGITGWAKWLASFVEELESGESFEIGASDASEGSEDEVGYDSYFYDGNGRGQGDGGGDSGSGGGLRYTGEYRGWNVLEAWADRSLRRWHEAGVITDSALEPIQEDSKAEEDQQDLHIVELSLQGSGTEIPIPILNSSSEHIPSPTVNALSQTTKTHSRLASTVQPQNPVPTISVTKPPAPRPVVLPTTSDITVGLSRSASLNFDDDLESGRVNGMREVAEDVGLVTSTRKIGKAKSPIRRETSDASGSALPASPPPELVSSSSRSTSSTKSPSPPPAIPDLLADVDEHLQSLSLPAKSILDEDVQTPTQLVIDTSSSQQGEEPEPDTTIRLVGGGGQAGISSPVAMSPAEDIQEIQSESEKVQDSDVSSVASVASVASAEATNKKGEKTHKKSKSSLALKKLSQLGGGKKKSDSVSSTKETTAP